jgi:hypothetical protein
MLDASQEWFQPGHILLGAASAELPLDLDSLVSNIVELGIGEFALIVWSNSGRKTLEGVLESEARLG